MTFMKCIGAAMLASAALSGAAIAETASGKGDRLDVANLLPGLDVDGLGAGTLILPASAPADDAFALALRDTVRIVPTGDYLPATYSAGEFADNMMLIPWETAAVVGGTVAVGIFDWNWGNAHFHFGSEGFFGLETTSGGMDKMGHAYGTALMADFFTERMIRNGAETRSAALTGSLMSYGVMGLVEVFDGFSSEHGFAPEDIVMNTIGATFSYLRNTVPGMKEKVDFRLEYFPSGYEGDFTPHADYAGQKYILALKLAGFEQFEQTPLRYFELQAGYFTEGFNNLEAHDRKITESRHPFLAVGINLEQVLFGYEEEGESRALDLSRKLLQRVQVPYTYATWDKSAYHY